MKPPQTPSSFSAKKRFPIWVFIIVGLLTAHVVGMVVAMTIAVRDKSFSVVENYYDKAQHWDQAQAERRASVLLGWTVGIEAAANADAQGQRKITFTLRDAAGAVLPGATLSVDYFHHAHADQLHTISLSPSTADPRRFEAMMHMPYAGIWEFHLTATSGGKTYKAVQTQFIGVAAHGGDLLAN